MIAKKQKDKGQSTLEYILLFTVIIAVLLIFLNPTTGVFRDVFNNTLTDATNGMTVMANRLKESRP